MKSKNNTLQHLGFIALAFAGLAANSAHAATTTWVGNTDANFNTLANWNSVTPNGNTPTFGVAGSFGTTLNNNISSASYAGLTFNSGASAYTIGGNSFTLTGNITNSSTSTQTINTAMTATATRTFTATSGQLVIGGDITTAFTSATSFNGLNLSSANKITLGGTNNLTSNFASGSALTVSAGAGGVDIIGATTLTGSAAGNNGYLNINGAVTLTVQSSGSLTLNGTATSSPNALIGQNAAGTSTLLVNGGTLTVSANNGFVLGNNLDTAVGVLTIASGTATINRGTLATTTNTTDTRLIMMGRDKATGTINLNGGTLATDRQFVKDGSSGTGSGSGTGTANFVFGGGTLKALANQTDWLQSTTATSAGQNIGATGGTVNTNALALTSVTTTAVSTIDSNSYSVAINSAISGAGGFNINSSTGTGTVTFGGANSYVGTTKVTAGTLVADTATNATVLSASSNLVMAGGTFQLKGLAATVRSQTLNGLNVSFGANVVDANNLGTSTTLDLRGSGGSQTITCGSNATVDFKATTGTLGTTALIQVGTTNTNGLIGGWATVNGGTDFASNSTDTPAGYVVAATSSGGDLGDSGVASDSTLNFKPSGTQTDLTSAKTFNSLNFSGSTGASMTGSGAITAASGGMIYNSTGGITGGTLAGSATGELILHTTQALSLGSTSIINNGGATALTKSGTSTLTLGTANTYSGNTTVNAGTLALGASGSIVNSPVIAVRSGATLDVSATGGWSVQGAGSSNRQTLTGSGNVTGATTIGSFGTHNAGDNGVGKQTLSSSLTYASGSIFEWDLAATPATTGRGTAYDAVNAASLGNTTGAIFRVVLNGAQDFSATFWDTNQTWTDIFKTGDAGTNLSFASIFSGGVQYYNGSGVLTGVTSTQGAFTMSGNTLTWSPVPEPTSALAGVLLGAGLLRRRRKN